MLPIKNNSFLKKGILKEVFYIMESDLSENIIITDVNTDDYDNRVTIVNPHYLEGFSVDNFPYKLEFLRGGLIHKGLDSLGYHQTIKTSCFHNQKKEMKRFIRDNKIKQKRLWILSYFFTNMICKNHEKMLIFV